MDQFFPMPRGDRWFVAVLVGVAVVAFLPAVRSLEWAGMSLLGWVMAGLMVLSPTLALVRLLAGRRRQVNSAWAARDGARDSGGRSADRD